MKVSSATSARATASPRRTGRSSAPPLSHTSAKPLELSGPSDLPDPAIAAYRRDLADVALAGQVIASHYAEPVERRLAIAATLRAGPSAEADPICELAVGDIFSMLDDSVGWAWGYAGKDRRVGYVGAQALKA